MEKNMLFIYNPFAGKAEIPSRLNYIINYFTQNGYTVTVRPTQRNNDAFETVVNYGSFFDYVVCAGGDGTLNETASGLAELARAKKHTPTFGYIPAGSTNDFANTKKIPIHLDDALEVIVRRKTKTLDMGTVNGRYFTYVAAFGLFTDVSYDTPQNMKNIFGHTAYILEGVKRLGSVNPIECQILFDDGETIEDKFVLGMITNSMSVGGFNLPKDYFFDGEGFLMILLKYCERFIDYQGVIPALLGVREPQEHFIIKPVEQVDILCKDEIAWTVDGEFGGKYKENHVDIINDKINIAVDI